jgi:hypothetical protein
MTQNIINIKIVKRIILSLILMSLLTACCNEEQAVEPLPAKITVLVYMVADNSLSGEVEQNIESIMCGIKNNTVSGNVVIYVDQLGNVPQLIQLQKKSNGTVVKNTVKTYSEQNSVYPTVMASVFNDMVQYFPAKNYGLVLWSHGYGWLPGANNTKTVSTRWFGQDVNNYMSMPDLVTALKMGPHFNYILFDACFMGGVETAYALRNSTDYLIASPAEVLADGFPYSDIIPYLMGNNESDYVKTASLYYEHYNKENGYTRSAAVGVTKCSQLDTLAALTKKLIVAHATELNAFKASSVQYLESYSPHLFYDFGHFIESFTSQTERSAFEDQLDKTILYKACTPNILSVNSSVSHYIPIAHFSGLNTYIPTSDTMTNNASYHDMEWYAAAGWNSTEW